VPRVQSEGALKARQSSVRPSTARVTERSSVAHRQPARSPDHLALLDIDGTLISTGGAGAASRRLALEEPYGVPANIGKFTDAGMTDLQVARRTFAAVVGHAPSRKELSSLLERRLNYLYTTVADSTGYRILPGVE
jgi:hypothetical protein